MKRFSFVFLLVGASALALADASLRAEIISMKGPVDHALMHKDAAAFSKAMKGHVTPDFKYSDDGGKPMDFDAMVGAMKQGLAMQTKVTKADASLVSLKESGSTGSAVTRHTMEATSVGADKKPHHLVYSGLSTDTYRKVKGHWQMASMSMKTEKMIMDGKSMPMGH